MRKFGLIGMPLKHSFSKKYFTEKFQKLGLRDCQYDLFEIEHISLLQQVLAENHELVGLNVTIPYKEQVIPYLDELEPGCDAIGAVNTIKITEGSLKGFNTDYIGFRQSLLAWLGQTETKALVLGTGGASRAVRQALKDLSIPYCVVSRTKNLQQGFMDYQDLSRDTSILEEYRLIVNTTPIGTFPNTEEMPPIPLEQINSHHKVYDLVYNPEITLLMKSVAEKGGATKNGLEMLHLQAEAAWEIWNKS